MPSRTLTPPHVPSHPNNLTLKNTHTHTHNPPTHLQIVHTQVRVATDAGGFKGDDLCALLVVILNALKVLN